LADSLKLSIIIHPKAIDPLVRSAAIGAGSINRNPEGIKDIAEIDPD